MNAKGTWKVMLCVAALGGAACESDRGNEEPPPVSDGGSTDATAAGDTGEPADPCCGVWGACTSVDADGDGYDSDVDCDDTNAAVNPGATEGPWGDPTCCDGLDNDCSGLTDPEMGDGCCNMWAACTEEV